MSGFRFRKYHGLGNDYLVVDPAEVPLEPAPEAMRALCDRNRGPGGDGVLLGPFRTEGGLSVRIFNPDGGEAEKSGNGARIFARYLLDRGYVAGPAFGFDTKGGRIEATALDPEGARIRLDMGEASFRTADHGLATAEAELVDAPARFAGVDCRITCVSMGNPHCVVTGLGAEPETAARLGPAIETDRLFPERTNVQFLEVLGPGELRIAIWERGAGPTLASGSSSCAAAAAARRLGLSGDSVTVRMPGGALEVAFEGMRAFLTGPVEPVFEGTLSERLAARILAGGGAP